LHAALGALALGVAALCAPLAALAAKHVVAPGESIQAAVDAAKPRDTVVVMPGDYMETHGGSAAVLITKSLKLIAKSQPGPGASCPVPGTSTASIEPRILASIRMLRTSRSRLQPSWVPKNGICLRYARP
jgi:hypothetical protein